MISLQQANETISKEISPTNSSEKTPLVNALHRVLAQPILADIDQPSFDKSAMDGYACRSQDLPGPLLLKDKLAAGDSSEVEINPGECVQIFTGARIPKGADCVIVQEQVQINKPGNVLFTASETKNNICYQGEDAKQGDKLIPAGSLLQAHDLAIVASAGIDAVQVFTKPLVGIICTGNELIDVSEKPSGGKIRNTNLYQLIAQIQKAGGLPQYYGVIADNMTELLSTVQRAIAECDMLITTGGASVGEFDLIPEAFLKAGCTIHFKTVAIQPGKPVIFATTDGKPCFGLSGNPVSSFLQFHLIVNPCLLKLGGNHFPTPNPKITVARSIVRKKSERDLFIPVKLTSNGTIAPVEFNGSAHITALHGIYGFARVPKGIMEIEPGQHVECITI
jgi:molybdopterin molybdotransferase